MADGRPVGFLHALPQAKGPQTEVQKKRRLVLLGRDQPDNVFAEALGDLLGLDVGDEAVAVGLGHEGIDTGTEGGVSAGAGGVAEGQGGHRRGVSRR